jgi:thioredoxin-related protein
VRSGRQAVEEKEEKKMKKEKRNKKRSRDYLLGSPFSANKIYKTGEKKVQITSKERGTEIAEVKTQETSRE